MTNLNFILHAPFLLTDSREGIKAGEKHNQELVQQLAQLAADSLPILRDEKLIDDGTRNGFKTKSHSYVRMNPTCLGSSFDLPWPFTIETNPKFTVVLMLD